MARRHRWLVPVIVTVGVAGAVASAWMLVYNKPKPGAVIDTLALDDRAKLVVRDEAGGNRSFVELAVDGTLRWSALVPAYAGRPGVPAIAWNDDVVSVRVVRDRKAEIFAVSMRDASKVGGIHLAPDKGPIRADAKGPVTLTDHIRSYEIVAGDGWNQLITIDLRLGKILWSRELGPMPVDAAGLEPGGLVWTEQAGSKRFFDVYVGKENRTIEKIGLPPTDGVAPVDPGRADPDFAPTAAGPENPAVGASNPK